MLKTTKDKKGFLLPYLLALDRMFFKRWHYWLDIVQTNRLSDEPIPFIPFKSLNAYPERNVHKNLTNCLNHAAHQLSHPLEALVDWILHGLNHDVDFPPITDQIDDYWYRTFNLGLFYVEPADHWPELASEVMGRSNHSGFFPTPANVVDMMVKMNFGSDPKPEHKTMSVCDPCCGTGNMLLYASNYSLNLYGQDISPLLTKMALINAYVYMPWVVCRPKSLTVFESKIVEKELPSGIKIPVCTNCVNHEQRFFMELLTEAELTISAAGHFDLTTPNVDSDLVAQKLKAENISCSRCDGKI